MKLKIFSVFDDKASAFIPPFFLPNSAMAIRAFTQCVNDPSHQFGQNPGDYTLFELGEFDDSDGSIDLLMAQKNHGSGLIHKRTLADSTDLVVQTLNGHGASDLRETPE